MWGTPSILTDKKLSTCHLDSAFRETWKILNQEWFYLQQIWSPPLRGHRVMLGLYQVHNGPTTIRCHSQRAPDTLSPGLGTPWSRCLSRLGPPLFPLSVCLERVGLWGVGPSSALWVLGKQDISKPLGKTPTAC